MNRYTQILIGLGKSRTKNGLIESDTRKLKSALNGIKRLQKLKVKQPKDGHKIISLIAFSYWAKMRESNNDYQIGQLLLNQNLYDPTLLQESIKFFGQEVISEIVEILKWAKAANDKIITGKKRGAKKTNENQTSKAHLRQEGIRQLISNNPGPKYKIKVKGHLRPCGQLEFIKHELDLACSLKTIANDLRTINFGNSL